MKNNSTHTTASLWNLNISLSQGVAHFNDSLDQPKKEKEARAFYLPLWNLLSDTYTLSIWNNVMDVIDECPQHTFYYFSESYMPTLKRKTPPNLHVIAIISRCSEKNVSSWQTANFKSRMSGALLVSKRSTVAEIANAQTALKTLYKGIVIKVAERNDREFMPRGLAHHNKWEIWEGLARNRQPSKLLV